MKLDKRKANDDQFDPVISDEPLAHASEASDAFSPSLIGFTIESGDGDRILSRILTARGRGPHPTALLLHGMPGNELNLDLAHAIRRAGWNVLLIHYRGSWGSQGSFRLANLNEDILSAIKFIRGEGQSRFRCDPNRIALIGHSTGGFAALQVAAQNPVGVIGTASLAGYNFGATGRELYAHPELRKQAIDFFKAMIAPLSGITPEILVEEILQGREKWDLEKLAPRLTEMPLWIVGGDHDSLSIPSSHHQPLIHALRAVPRQAEMRETVFDSDHYFSEARVALTRETLSWLATLAPVG